MNDTQQPVDRYSGSFAELDINPVKDGEASPACTDAVAVEEPLEIRIGHQSSGRWITTSLSVTMRTPGHDFELAAGFLFSEGIIRSYNDVAALQHAGRPRSYSLSSAPSADRYRISVKREPHGAAGAYIDTRVQAGDILDVSAPRGAFTLRQDARPVVLVSAGIGSTPVLAMLYALAAEQPRREIWWIYGARNSDEHPFAAEARELLKSLPGSRSHIRYSAPKPTDRPAVDFDSVGRVDVRLFEEMGVPPDADFYICGPTAFMSGLVDGLAGSGVARDRLHTENFGSGESMTPGVAAGPRRPPHPPQEAAEVGPLVSFARSNLAVHWGSAFTSLLELAEACDVPVRWACRTGVCHNCETGLISGSVIYRPDPVEPPAEGNLLICCSQPQGDIALDL